MNRLFKAGIGIILTGLGFGLQEITLLGIDFASFDPFILLIVQIGLVIAGLGLALGGGSN